MGRRFDEDRDGNIILIRQNRKVKVGHGFYDADFRCGPHKNKQDKRKGNRQQELQRILRDSYE